MAQPGSGQGMRQGNRPAPGILYGRVLDAGTKEALEYATVTVLPLNKDTILGGAMVKANGDFRIEKLPLSELRVKISFIGYKTIIQTIRLSPQSMELDLGNIRMETNIAVMEDIVIEAEKSTMVMGIDRRVFNVDKDLSARGGTGLDVMKNIPGITVDAEGNVEVRNQSPIIFVDGRPSTMTLEQIPADQIERIEVITNPSVKFDAGSTGGIINVVLKKNRKPGYNGVLGAGAGTNDRYNFNGSLNVKEGKWSLGASYNYNQGFNPGKGYTNRINYRDEVMQSGFRQDTEQNFGRAFQFGRFTSDYEINNRSNLGFNFNLNQGSFKHNENQVFSIFDSSFTTTSTGFRKNTVLTGFNNYNAQLLYRYTFPESKHEINTDLTLNSGRQTNSSLFETWNYFESGILLPDNPEQQKNLGGGNTQNLTWQMDYTGTIGDSSKIEAGLRTNIKLNETGQDVYLYNYYLSDFIKDSLVSANYSINDQVHAAYFNYLGRWKKWGYAAGLRYEQTIFRGEMKEQNLRFQYLYPQGSKNFGKAFFPALYLTRQIGAFSEMQINFSRKIHRPGYRQIMPYIMFADRQSYSIGNPALSPEFINLAEINFNTPFKKGNLFTSFFGRYTQDVITNFIYPLPSDSSVLVNTFINGRDSKSFGWESAIRYTLLKPLELTLSGNISYVEIQSGQGADYFINSGYNWNTKFILSYKIRKDLIMQINGNYDAPRIIPQGKTIEVYSVDFSLNKDFNRKVSLTFTINDIFNTRRFGGLYESPLFLQEFSRRRQTRFFRLNLTWRFGEMDTSLFRRKSSTQRRDSGAGAGEMDF